MDGSTPLRPLAEPHAEGRMGDRRARSDRDACDGRRHVVEPRRPVATGSPHASARVELSAGSAGSRMTAMLRRDFLKSSAAAGAGALAAGVGTSAAMAGQQGAPAVATRKPIRIVMGGYGPATTGFSLALKKMGDRLTAKFGRDVDVK